MSTFVLSTSLLIRQKITTVQWNPGCRYRTDDFVICCKSSFSAKLPSSFSHGINSVISFLELVVKWLKDLREGSCRSPSIMAIYWPLQWLNRQNKLPDVQKFWIRTILSNENPFGEWKSVVQTIIRTTIIHTDQLIIGSPTAYGITSGKQCEIFSPSLYIGTTMDNKAADQLRYFGYQGIDSENDCNNSVFVKLYLVPRQFYHEFTKNGLQSCWIRPC